MTYALKLDDDGRILSVTYGKYATSPGYALVAELPEGNVADYRYVEGDFIYDPVPEEKVEQGVTLETRVGELEEALDMILSGVTE